MTTYSVTYQPEGSLFFKTWTLHLSNVENVEDAAWYAKNYCTENKHTLINVEQIDEA